MATSPLISTNSSFQPVFSFHSRKSSRSTNGSNQERPASPTASTTTSPKEPSSPLFNNYRHESVSTSGYSRRRTSILSFLSNSSRKTSMTEDSDDFHPHDGDSKPGSFSRRSSLWNRRKSKSQAYPHVTDIIDHAYRDDPTKPQGLYPPEQSHEIMLLDSVIPEEGLSEGYESYHENDHQHDIAGNKNDNCEIEWFTSEEEAQKRTEEILRGRGRGSAHWLHSTGTTSAGSNASHSDADSASEYSEVSERERKSSNGGGGFLGKLSHMAGLNSNSDSANNKRDRASSVPIRRKSSKAPKKSANAEKGAKKDRPKSIPTANLMINAYNDDENRKGELDSGPDPKRMSAEPMHKAPTQPMPTTAGSSMWDTLNKRRMRAMSIFSPNPRGDYAAVQAT